MSLMPVKPRCSFCGSNVVALVLGSGCLGFAPQTVSPGSKELHRRVYLHEAYVSSFPLGVCGCLPARVAHVGGQLLGLGYQ